MYECIHVLYLSQQVTLGRTLQVVLVLQSFIIERVIVRAHHEVILQVDGTVSTGVAITPISSL